MVLRFVLGDVVLEVSTLPIDIKIYRFFSQSETPLGVEIWYAVSTWLSIPTLTFGRRG